MSEIAKSVITHSALSMFKSCRFKYYLRHVHQLDTIDRPDYLYFGTIIHKALEMYYSGTPFEDDSGEDVKDYLFKACQDKLWHQTEKLQELYAYAMMHGYVRKYPVGHEPWEVVEVEPQFECALVNPKTGRPSRKYRIAGKADMLVKMPGTDEYYLVEHKTAASLTEDYIENIWTDDQIYLYGYYLAKDRNIRIVGCIYNVLVKSGMRRKGMRSKKPDAEIETSQSLLARLLEVYQEPSMFYRETVLFERSRVMQMLDQHWEINRQLVEAHARQRDLLKLGPNIAVRGAFYDNKQACNYYNRKCFYFDACRSNFHPLVMDGKYVSKTPHQELQEENDNGTVS